MRKYDDILLDLEELLDEMVDDHGMQRGDILSWINYHLGSHRADCVEQEVEGGNFVMYYGPVWEKEDTLEIL